MLTREVSDAECEWDVRRWAGRWGSGCGGCAVVVVEEGWEADVDGIEEEDPGADWELGG